MRYILLLLSLLPLMLSAQGTDYCIQGRFSQIPYFSETEVVSVKNVTYGLAPRWPSATVDTLKMDVYMPDPALDPFAKRPFILLIHGGAFYGGQREDMTLQCIEYAKRGYVAATMSYRLGWDCNPINALFVCATCGPQVDKLRVAAYRSVQDTRAALRFAAYHASDYGIDPETFFVGGTSAGSVAAIHAIYLDQTTADEFCPGCVSAVGELDSAVNDIQADYTIRGLLNNCGAILLPAALENEPEIPMINFHDDGDCVVPSNIGWALGCLNCTSFFQGYGSQQIHAFADNLGTCSELNLRANSLSHCSFPVNTVINRSSCFMKKIFCGSCTTGTNNNINAVEPCNELGEPVSTDIPEGTQFVQVYPNPNKGTFYLDYNGKPLSGNISIQMFDLMGRTVLNEQRAVNAHMEINVNHLGQGLFLLQLTHPELQMVKKITLTP